MAFLLLPLATLASLLLCSVLAQDSSGQGLSVVTIDQESPGLRFESQNVSFTCTINGASDGNYTWLRNGVELTNSDVNHTIFDNQLFISYLTVAQWNGTSITCQAVTMVSYGNASLDLLVASRSPTFTLDPVSVTVNVGDNFTITCAAVGLPPLNIELHYSDGAIAPTFVFTEISEGVFYVKSADDSFTAGEYFCKASNIHGQTNSNTANVTVYFGPVIENMGADANFTVGQPGLLNCSVRGFPPPVITWTKNDKPVNVSESGRVQILAGGALNFTSVNLMDAGLYMCIATTPHNNNTAQTDDIMVEVFMPPQLTTFPEGNVVRLGESVTFSCEALAVPSPSYSWEKAATSDGTNGEAIVIGGRMSISEGSLTISEVNRSDRGYYTCVVDNGINMAVSAPAVKLTVNAPPLSPTSIFAESVGSSWILVNWTVVDDDEPAISRFHIEYKLSFRDNWNEASPVATVIRDYNITGLHPSAPYEVRVQASSPSGQGDPSQVVMATTLAGVPNKIEVSNLKESVQLQSNSSDSLTVSWTVPEILLMTSYSGTTLELTHPNGTTEELQHNSTSVTFTDLSPATNYDLMVTFRFAGDFIAESNLNGSTMEDVPGNAPNITDVTAISSTTLSISWLPPTDPNGMIVAYTISTDPVSFSQPIVVNASVNSYEIAGLSPYTNYTIVISSNTSVGQGPYDTTVARTLEGVPPAPAMLEIIPLNSTSLMVSWQQLADEDVPGILVNYTIKYNKLHHGHSPLCKQVPPNSGDTILTELDPYTLYKVSVAAATGAGLGNYSEVSESRTFGDVPVAVVMLEELNKSCPGGLFVQWAELDPRQFRGPEDEIRLVIVYTAQGGSDGAAGGNITVNYTGNNSLILEGLSVFTNYSVQVAVANSNGTSKLSEPLYAFSCDGSAPPPSITLLVPVNATALRLTWQQLDDGDIPGIIVNYTIEYSTIEYSIDGSDRSPTEVVSAESLEVVINDLSPYTNYSVRIASNTRDELGNFSSSHYSRTYGESPVVQLNISSLTDVCPPVGLMVVWTKPQTSDLRGPLEDISYVLTYSTDGASEQNVSVHVSNVTTVDDQSLSFVLEGLEENTTYNVTVAVRNANGTSPPSEEFPGMTANEGVPSAPLNVTANTTGPTNLTVTWQPPSMPNGQPRFIIYYIASSSTESATDYRAWQRLNKTYSDRQAVINDLTPYTNYTLVVAAKTNCSESAAPQIKAPTQEGTSTAPLDLRVTASLPRSVTITWAMPTSPNGLITSYKVYCPVGVEMASNTDKLVHHCTNLEPEMTYEIAVSAINGAGESGNITVITTTACEDSDPVLNKTGELLTISAGERDERIENCSVKSLFILIVVQEFTGGTPSPPSLKDISLSGLLEKNEAYNRRRSGRQTETVGVYIAANITMAVLKDGFMLGDGSRHGQYTNHRLRPGYSYNVGLMSGVNGTTNTLFTAANMKPIVIPPVIMTTSPASSSDDFPVTMTTSPAPSSDDFPLIPVVAGCGGAIALLVLAICLACIIICCCRCCSRRLDKLETNGGRLERGGSFRLSRRKLIDPIDSFRNNHRTEALEEHPPIPVMGFINKLAVMQTNDNQLFLEEFGSIDMNPQYSTDVAKLPLNTAKNRYNNILPYDHSRVKLSSHKHSTDYINANFCSGYMKPKTYIATQGPTPESIGDFWRMVWEQDSRTIVMLTNPFEKGKLKCEVYWPREVGASSMHSNIEVTLTEMTQLADYTIRTFTIHKGGTSKEPREIRHFHFTSWPDHGVPQYATAMLAMLRRVKSWQPPAEAGPVVVHCSAGVGRSGTYIVIDTMLERLKNGDELIDIYGHVSLLRTQRPYMVQTEDQYFFIHEAVAEALLCGNTEVKVDQLHSYVQDLYSLIPEDEAGHSRIEVQFKRLALDRNDPNRFVTATKDANKSKNRYVNVLPYEINRVCLEFMRGVDGSDYINASHIDSYHVRRAFIATQGPLQNTVVDFWRMVWQYNTPVIVMLTECMEKGTERSFCYWPTEVRTSQQYNKFTVEMTVERNSTHYSYRDLYITNTECQQKRLVRQFHFHSWPEVGVPSNPMVLVEFIREVQKLYSSLNTKSPLVIHCSNGVGRTGVFIALHIVLERMVVEGLVDIFQTVKNLRIQRPAMVQSLDQYHFCYDATLDYVDTTDMVFNLRQRSQSVLTSASSESKRKHRPSVDNTPSRSPAKNSQPRSSGSLSRSTPVRTESFKGSSRNLEMNQLGNGVSQIYGGSEGTSTFGNHRNSANTSPPPAAGTSSLSNSQVQLNTLPQNNSQTGGSQGGLSQPLSGSQPQLHFGLGEEYKPSTFNVLGGGSQPTGYGEGLAMAYQGAMMTGVQIRPTPAHQLSESQRYSTTSTNRSSTGEAS